MSDSTDCSTSGQSLDEFGIIGRFFTCRTSVPDAWPSQGVGDDCAFLDVGCCRIAVTTDMMAMGTHFLDNADPYTVGRKSLAVNLSDLAAAGSTPKAFFLSISLPSADAVWLEGYSRGLLEESLRYGCPLRGGDTVKAPILNGVSSKTTISICALGELPTGKGLTRNGAQVGDDVWVSGTPGDAFAALGTIWGYWLSDDVDFAYFKQRMDLPTPRINLGQQLLDIAHAACDISDGLTGDLQHILDSSGVSADLYWKDFPLSAAMLNMPAVVRKRCVLSGGDDYELLFTASPKDRNRVEKAGINAGVRLTRIGRIVSPGSSLRVFDEDGQLIRLTRSFNHFGEDS